MRNRVFLIDRMSNQRLDRKLSLQAVAKRVVSLILGIVLMLGLVQPAVQAASTGVDTTAVNTEAIISPEKLEQMRAERSAMQSQASKAANDEETAGSLGEVLNKKLNLEEISEENVIVDDVLKLTDSEKSYQK